MNFANPISQNLLSSIVNFFLGGDKPFFYFTGV